MSGKGIRTYNKDLKKEKLRKGRKVKKYQNESGCICNQLITKTTPTYPASFDESFNLSFL